MPPTLSDNGSQVHVGATDGTAGGTVKVRNSLKALKKIPGAQIVRRRGRTFVINKRDPRSKARQG